MNTMLEQLMCLLRTRGRRRRQEILTLLSEHPDHEYSVTDVSEILNDWAGPVHADLVLLRRRGRVCRQMYGTRPYYRIKLKDEVTA
jgi:hypothetical protein